MAELLARRGRRVHLCVNGYMPGQRLQQYVRDSWLATIHRLHVAVVPLVRLYGSVPVLQGLLASGAVRVPIAARFPLEQVEADLQRLSERTRAESVWIFMPSSARREHAGTSVRAPSSS